MYNKKKKKNSISYAVENNFQGTKQKRLTKVKSLNSSCQTNCTCKTLYKKSTILFLYRHRYGRIHKIRRKKSAIKFAFTKRILTNTFGNNFR